MTDRIRVLHVDDDPAVVDAATRALEQGHCGITVETAATATDGRERLDGSAFDCVIAGYDLPERSGDEFLDAVRKRAPDLPFVLFTSEGSEAGGARFEITGVEVP